MSIRRCLIDAAAIHGTTMLRIQHTTLAIAFAAVTIPAKAVDLDALTVVTMAQDGSWGVATAASQGLAIAAAIRDCSAMAAAPSDCGAQFVTTRGGWVVANLCGEHKIIVAAETRQAAEQVALSRELNLKRLYEPNVLRCRRVLTVGADGAVLLGQAAPTLESVADGRTADCLFSGSSHATLAPDVTAAVSSVRGPSVRGEASFSRHPRQ